MLIFLAIELNFSTEDLDGGLLLLYNHLKSISSVSIQLLSFEYSEFQMRLLEHSLITVGFPNTSNLRFCMVTNWTMNVIQMMSN